MSAAEQARARRLQRARQAFVASADLKPMAAQLLKGRTPVAYGGVEAYARRNGGAAGALAWLVVGYARLLDENYGAAIPALQRARANAGEVADYVDYFLGAAQQKSGAYEAALETLSPFNTRHADSALLADASLVVARASLAMGDGTRALAALQAHAADPDLAIQLELGRAYAATGDTARAAQLWKKLVLESPTAPEAAEALQELRAQASRTNQEALTYDERRQFADALMKRRRYSLAVGEYRALLRERESDEVLVALGGALYRSGNDREAKTLLERLPERGAEPAAQKLYYLAEIARSRGDRDEHAKLITRLREVGESSPWFEEALLSSANMHLLSRDHDTAARFFTELQQRFQAGKYASYAQWKAAWLYYRTRKFDQARRMMDELLAWYPAASEVPNTLYWRGRIAERDGDAARARGYYQKLESRFQSYYYAELARQRLSALGTGAVTLEPSLGKIPAPPELPGGARPEDDLRLQKALLLANAAMTDLAVRELQAAGREPQNKLWAALEIAKLHRDNGQPHRALQTLKRAVPAYFALDLEALPREIWEGLFPRSYWTELRRYAMQNRLEPYLVSSLIRQESEFNPGAVSAANAYGLMQLLPDTGRQVARRLKVRRFHASQLFVPQVNLQLGMRYFREMVDRFGGRVEYALAAYNAGSHRVDDWLANGEYEDMAEFVEAIPFTETREYVQAILRNERLYRRLYGGDARAVVSAAR